MAVSMFSSFAGPVASGKIKRPLVRCLSEDVAATCF